MEIIAVVSEIGQVVQGTSANGTWQRQSVVLTNPMDNKSYALTFNGSNIKQIENLAEGETARASFVIDCHKYENNWFTELRGTRIVALR